MGECLKVQDVSKQYGGSDFKLQNISFTVPEGSIVGIVGENGSGKTTIIQLILDLIRKDGGEITFSGDKGEMGVVLESGNFSDSLTPEKIGRVMRDIYKTWDDTLFRERMERFGIPKKQKVKTFSRGTVMKLAIITAMSHNPKLLILDEATNTLDPVVRDEILETFLEFIEDEKKSILISSHLTKDLEKIADYIVFLHKGKVELAVQKDELLYEYGIARCIREQFKEIDTEDILRYRQNAMQTDVLVKNRKLFSKKYKEIVLDRATIDETMVMLVKGGCL